MKAPDKVVKKAMEKLKEVKISKENGGKARQYLDGLLQVPFGYYHKEEIFSFFEEYKEKLENVISLINCKLDEIENKNFKEYLEEIINNYYIKINTNNDSAINNFIKYLDECLLDFNKYLHLDSNQIEQLLIRIF